MFFSRECSLLRGVEGCGGALWIVCSAWVYTMRTSWGVFGVEGGVGRDLYFCGWSVLFCMRGKHAWGRFECSGGGGVWRAWR